jgi:hypothetical protein
VLVSVRKAKKMATVLLVSVRKLNQENAKASALYYMLLLAYSINMFYPSIAAHILQGLLLLVSVVAIALNVKALDAYRGLVILLLVTICVGIHGISHLGLEKEYRFMV